MFVTVSEYAGWFLAQLFGILAILTVYKLGLHLRGHHTGILSALLVATGGVFIHYSNRILTEQPAAVIAAIALVSAFESTRRGSRVMGLLSGALMMVAIAVRVSAVVISLTVFIVTIIAIVERRKREPLISYNAFAWIALGAGLSFMAAFMLFPSVVSSTIIEIIYGGSLYDTMFESGQIIENIGSAFEVWVANVLFLNESNTYMGLYFSFFTILATISLGWVLLIRNRKDLPIIIWLLVYLGAYALAPLRYKPDLWRYIFPAFLPACYLIAIMFSDTLPYMQDMIKRGKEWLSQWTIARCNPDKRAQRNRAILIVATIILVILLRLPLLILCFTLPLLLLVTPRRKCGAIEGRQIPILLILSILTASALIPASLYSISIAEVSIEDWERWTVPDNMAFGEIHADADFEAWMVAYGFPYVQQPDNLTLSDGVFVWLDDSSQSRKVFIVCRNATGYSYKLKVRFKGYGIDGISKYNQLSSANWSITNGYFSEATVNIEASSNGGGVVIDFFPVMGAYTHFVEIDVLDERVDSISYGNERVELPHKVSATWIRFSLRPQMLSQNDSYFASVRCHDAAFDRIEFVGNGESSVNTSGNPIADLAVSVNWTGHQRLDFYVGWASSTYPSIILEEVRVSSSSENDSTVATMQGLLELPYQMCFVLIAQIDSGGYVHTGASQVGIALILIVSLVIALVVTLYNRVESLSLAILAIVTMAFGCIFLIAPNVMLDPPYSSAFSMGDMQSWLAFFIGIRLFYLSALTFMVLARVALVIGSQEDTANHIIEFQDDKLKAAHRKASLMLQHWKDIPIALLFIMFLLMITTGIGFGIAETDSTRDFFQSIVTASAFLEETYEPGINVLTSRDGSQYLSWYTRDRFIFLEIPIGRITGSSNITQTVLDFIDQNDVKLVVVIEWLAHHLNYVYSGLAQKGILREVRVYHDRWQRTFIYEVL